MRGLAQTYGYYYGSSNTGESLDSKYQAVLDAATLAGYTLPSSARQSIESSAAAVITSANLWGKIKLFRSYQTDGDSDFATYNWANPATFKATKVNSPAFTSLEGFRSNGTTSYLNSNFKISDIPDEQLVAYFTKGLDNAQAANSFLFGAATTTSSANSIFINPRNTSDQISYRVSSTATITVTSATDSRNRICIGRESGNVFHSINGAVRVSAANTFGAVTSTRNLFSLAYETNAGAANFNARGAAYLVVMDLTGIADVDAAIATVDTALDILTV